MAVYRKLAEKFPSFRERSETTDLIVEISLQPWEAFHPDGVIIFSDILTPLPAFGVPFDIEEVRGPVIQSPIRSEEGLKALHPIDLEKVHFVGESLRILRQEVTPIFITCLGRMPIVLFSISFKCYASLISSTIYLFFYVGWWTCCRFRFCRSTLDNSYIYSGRGYNAYLYNHKEHVSYCPTCIESSSFSFDTGNIRLHYFPSAVWGSLHTNF